MPTNTLIKSKYIYFSIYYYYLFSLLPLKRVWLTQYLSYFKLRDTRQNIDKVISRLEWTVVLIRFHDWLKLISSSMSYPILLSTNYSLIKKKLSKLLSWTLSFYPPLMCEFPIVIIILPIKKNNCPTFFIPHKYTNCSSYHFCWKYLNFQEIECSIANSKFHWM
jgi:hypothetical protein